MRDEQVIRFNKEADEIPNYEAGDIVIKLCENPHGYFEREGDNLFIVKKISLYEALAVTAGETIDLEIKHLDGRILKLKTDKKALHGNEGIRKIKGEGMPLYKKEGKGDLFVRFNLDIPDSITKEQVKQLKQLFPPLNSKLSNENSVVNECVLEDVTDEDLDALDYGYSSDSDYDSSSYYSSSEEEQPRKGYRQLPKAVQRAQRRGK